MTRPELEEALRRLLREGGAGSELDRRLVHELEVHQVELEMQNRELRETQALLEESRARYQDLYDFAPVGYLTIDEDGTIRELNLTAAAMLGGERSRLLGAPLVRAMRVTQPAQVHEHLRRACEGRGRVTAELTAAAAGGTDQTFQLVSVPVRLADGTAGCRTAVTDVTERRHAEETMRFAADAGAVLASSLDYTVTLSRVARIALPRLGDWCVVHVLEDDGSLRQEAAGHADGEREVLLAGLRGRFGPERAYGHGVTHVMQTGRAELQPAVPSVIAMAQAIGTANLELVRELGARAYLCVPLRSAGTALGAMTFVWATARRIDASDLALAEDLARRGAVAIHNAHLYQEAQRAILMRQDILATVTHDLRSPLSTISMCSQYLTRLAPPDDRIQRQIQTLGRAAEQMEALIRDLLDLSRFEAGHLTLERRPVGLAELLDQVMDLSQPVAARGSVSLAVEAPAGDDRVFCDRSRILRVFANLIGNAVKFSPEGATVRLRAERWDSDVCFIVSDHGVGIPTVQLRRIFHRYWRGDSDRARGTGLGLFIAKRIIDAHGGRIWAESQVGAGSSFYFTLPVALRADPEPAGDHA